MLSFAAYADGWSWAPCHLSFLIKNGNFNRVLKLSKYCLTTASRGKPGKVEPVAPSFREPPVAVDLEGCRVRIQAKEFLNVQTQAGTFGPDEHRYWS